LLMAVAAIELLIEGRWVRGVLTLAVVVVLGLAAWADHRRRTAVE
ncbi:MAG: hypothetical protein JO291_06405, partial [Acidimicrobiia bacterium]|nr:hypothetical protein [Acidimicrobiia bacterium]